MKRTKWIAMLLVLCMTVGILPVAAFAAAEPRDTLGEKAPAEKAGVWTLSGTISADSLNAAGDNLYEEAEPNDEPDTSNWIYHDMTVMGMLSGVDEDWYAFELADPSPVTVISACTTENLIYGLFDYSTGDLVAQCEYLGVDEETGLYMDGFSCELPAGLYFLLFYEGNDADAEYMFYFEAPGYETEPHVHDFGDGVVTKEPTCTENGVLTYTCSCGDSYTEEILANGHDFTNGKCSVCGATDDEIIASGKHDFGPVTWTLSANGTLTISGNRSMQDKNQSGYEWEEYAGVITRVVIEDGITNVPKGAFGNYPNLESVYLGNKVQEIDQYAFSGCPKLTSITIPASVEEIGKSAFQDCTGLKSLKFSSGSKLTAIGDYAFSGTAVTSALLPEGMRTVGESAFANCAKLDQLTLPNGLESISWNAFANCTALKQVVIPASVTTIRSDSFKGCTGIERLEIYTSQMVGNQFADNPKLKTLVLGDEITLLNDSFENCTGLTSLTLSKNLIYIDSYAFENCSALGSVTLPAGLEEIGGAAFRGTGLTALVIPDSVTELGMSCFESCEKLVTVKLGKGIKQIPNYAFSNCTSLTTVNLEAVQGVLSNAFAGCEKLTEVNLSGATEIMMEAFKDCVSLKTIVWPEKKVTMYHSVFKNCDSLVHVDIPASVTVITGSLFEDCDNLKTVKVSAAVTEVTLNAFSNCPKLESVVFLCEEAEFYKNKMEGTQRVVFFLWEDSSAHEAAVENEIPFVFLHDADHTFDSGSITREANCGNPGLFTYQCNDCDKTESLEFVTGEHTYDKGSVSQPASCLEAGTMRYTCTVCGAEKFGVIQPLGHDHSQLTPAHDKNGKNHGMKCVRCDSMADLESCTFGEGVTVKEATMETFGTAKYTCTVCGGSYEAQTAYRVFGSGRSETAIAVADELKAAYGVEKFDTIILASGEGFADALAGSYLAVKKQAPILLYRQNRMELNELYIRRNLAAGGTVYILGGKQAIPQEMEDALKDLNVVRLQGADRFETNLMILQEAGIEEEEILLCTGWNFADSLSASATGLPILMLNTTKNTLTPEQEAFLKQYADNGFTVIGGTAAVSEELVSKVDAIVGKVDRVSGSTREETSVAVARRYFNVPDYAVVAYSRNFPDGLCGGPLAHVMNSPLLLVNSGKEDAAADYVRRQGILKGFILGGPVAVSDESGRVVFGLD